MEENGGEMGGGGEMGENWYTFRQLAHFCLVLLIWRCRGGLEGGGGGWWGRGGLVSSLTGQRG